jgi:hypothetical protein
MDTFYAPPTLDLELCPKTDSIISKQPFLTSALENCCPSDFYHGKFERHFTFHLRIIILHRAAHHFTQLTSPAEPSLFIMGKQSRRKRGRDPNDIIADLNRQDCVVKSYSVATSTSFAAGDDSRGRPALLEEVLALVVAEGGGTDAGGDTDAAVSPMASAATRIAGRVAPAPEAGSCAASSLLAIVVLQGGAV